MNNYDLVTYLLPRYSYGHIVAYKSTTLLLTLTLVVVMLPSATVVVLFTSVVIGLVLRLGWLRDSGSNWAVAIDLVI